jgi:hypothetical protein
MMSVDETLLCSFQVSTHLLSRLFSTREAHSPSGFFFLSQILKPAEKKKTFAYGGSGQGRPVTPPRKAKGGKGGKGSS